MTKIIIVGNEHVDVRLKLSLEEILSKFPKEDWILCGECPDTPEITLEDKIKKYEALNEQRKNDFLDILEFNRNDLSHFEFARLTKQELDILINATDTTYNGNINKLLNILDVVSDEQKEAQKEPQNLIATRQLMALRQSEFLLQQLQVAKTYGIPFVAIDNQYLMSGAPQLKVDVQDFNIKLETFSRQRDAYMAAKIKDLTEIIKDKNILALVGLAHVEGIKNSLEASNKDDEIVALGIIPSNNVFLNKTKFNPYKTEYKEKLSQAKIPIIDSANKTIDLVKAIEQAIAQTIKKIESNKIFKKIQKLDVLTQTFFNSPPPTNWKTYPEKKLTDKYVGHYVRFFRMRADEKEQADNFYQYLKNNQVNVEIETEPATKNLSLVVDLTTFKLG